MGPDQTSSGLDFSYAWQSRWNLWAPLSPAIEIYGDTGTLGRSTPFAQQELLIGPVAIGSLRLDELGLGHAGKLKYELGWLFGATQGTRRGRCAGGWRWRFLLARGHPRCRKQAANHSAVRRNIIRT